MTERYQAALKGLNAAQRRAVETTDGPVLVIAGPGTGKTQLLTTRIAHILATTDTLPHNILCLTFTESGAQTMRERLSGMIGQAAYDVTISTYHAFGSELIRRYSEYFPEQADMQPVDDLGVDQILRKIVADLPFGNPLKYSDAYLGDLRSLISEAKRALLAPEELKTVASANLAFITKASPLVTNTLGVIARLSPKHIPLFRQLHTELAKLPEGPRPAPHVLPLPMLITDSLDEVVSLAQASNKTTTITEWKKDWLAKDDQGNYILAGEYAHKKLLAAADIYKKYLNELARQGLFDFDDMILRAVHALETNPDFRYTLQEHYQYILLDEFQDTNGAQLRLVELLTDNPVNEGRPNILAVGDDDQAIYAFQGANYSHMLHFNELYRDAVVIPLTENYRSHADILHIAEGVAGQIEERLHTQFEGIEKTLTAANTKLPASAIIERREAQSDVMQFAWVAERIEKLIADGIPPSEIAVLAPKHKFLAPLLPFLRARSIPLRYEKSENVLDDSAIMQLLSMSRLVLALGHGSQKLANALWMEVLSYDFWQLSTSRLWALSIQSNDEQHNWTDELLADAQLQPIALFFIRLSQLAISEPLETMLDYLIGNTPLDLREPGQSIYTSPFYEYNFGDGLYQKAEHQHFWELLSNLIVLRERLRTYHKEGDERLLLADFIGFVEAHRAADIKVLNTNPYASSVDTIQLLTAFKSKGMEFAAVFVLAVSDEAWGSRAKAQGSRLGLPANLQFIRYGGATDDERLRLFYVAITRAKLQLYLTSYATTFAGKQHSRLKYLNENTDEQGKIVSPLMPTHAQAILPIEDMDVQPTTELGAYWQTRHQLALSQPEVRSMLLERLKHYQLSPTHVNSFTDLANCGPQAFFLRTVLRFPEAPSVQLEYGNAMHETLEQLHLAAKKAGAIPELSTIQAIFSKRLKTKRLSEHDYQQLLERGNVTLEAYVSQRSHTILPENIVEHNFKNEGVFIGKAHLSGKIDKLIIDKQAKTIQIVDYKTGKAHSRWTPPELRLHMYRNQLYLYKALVEGSHTFAGYRVTDAYLEFVEPDEAGHIQELHLQFDDAEYQRIKQLAEAVWQHVTAVELPDTTSYSQDLGGIQNFEDDLLAG